MKKIGIFGWDNVTGWYFWVVGLKAVANNQQKNKI